MDHAEKEPFRKMLERNRVIPAVKDDAAMKKALHSSHDIVFILYGDILTLDDHVNAIIRSGKMPFVHLDMVNGLASNPVVLEYFYRHFKRNCGVLTTKSNMAKKALELGIRVVQRFFMLDSLSVESAIEGIGKIRTDAIEIMPGIIPRVISHIHRQTNAPIIAGGLINTASDIEKILAGGAIAVSTSRSDLWPLNNEQPAVQDRRAQE
ncbi:MAG TPA: glycerol-3-phosphate responsive antiterminator [Holophaga sp.]|nr:glycerol-3-phosphate responsive antiterminator [Holophaga sp.]HPS67193.1 glycerol-3-phosphate responsive antiterminator [Holophaga sp.]